MASATVHGVRQAVRQLLLNFPQPVKPAQTEYQKQPVLQQQPVLLEQLTRVLKKISPLVPEIPSQSE